ncbi:Disks large-like protein 1%2C partial [Scomber scombrus]|uniref:Disks large-like protein 1, partial n=1 Tax=Scomber scombrus TaxID=13677 RepID=A0AAV1Q4T5_SCOSC
MPVTKKDTARALGLLEEYCTKLSMPEEQQLKTAIQRVMGIFKQVAFENPHHSLNGSLELLLLRHASV